LIEFVCIQLFEIQHHTIVAISKIRVLIMLVVWFMSSPYSMMICVCLLEWKDSQMDLIPFGCSQSCGMSLILIWL